MNRGSDWWKMSSVILIDWFELVTSSVIFLRHVDSVPKLTYCSTKLSAMFCLFCRYFFSTHIFTTCRKQSKYVKSFAYKLFIWLCNVMCFHVKRDESSCWSKCNTKYSCSNNCCCLYHKLLHLLGVKESEELFPTPRSELKKNETKTIQTQNTQAQLLSWASFPKLCKHRIAWRWRRKHTETFRASMSLHFVLHEASSVPPEVSRRFSIAVCVCCCNSATWKNILFYYYFIVMLCRSITIFMFREVQRCCKSETASN